MQPNSLLCPVVILGEIISYLLKATEKFNHLYLLKYIF